MTLAQLRQALRPLKRRLQWRDSVKMAWLTLFSGLALSLILLIISRWGSWLLPHQVLSLGLFSLLILSVLGQAYVWLRPWPTVTLARLGDQYLQLEARLTTAFELLEGQLQTSSQLQEAQGEDTFVQLKQVSLIDALPLWPQHKHRWLTRASFSLLGLLFVAVVTLYLWPTYTAVQHPQQTALNTLLEEPLAQLEAVQADLLAEAELTETEDLAELNATLEELIAALREAQTDGALIQAEAEALPALSEAKQALTDLAQSQQAQQQALATLAEQLAALDLPSETNEALEPLTGETWRNLGHNLPTEAGQANQLAEALNQTADSLSGLNSDLAQNFQQAAEALQASEAAIAQEALQQAAAQLDDLQASQDTQAQLNQALSQVEAAQAQLTQQALSDQTGQRTEVNEQLAMSNEQIGQAGEGVEGQGNQGNATVGGQGQASGGSGQGEGDGGDHGLDANQGNTSIRPMNSGEGQSGSVEDYTSVYAPQFLGGETGDIIAPPRQNPEGDIDLPFGETGLNPNRDLGQAVVPYTEVYQAYQYQALQDLDNDYIPLGLKDMVRQYFGQLEPQ